MNTGTEKTTLTVRSILLYTLAKKVLLGIFCLYVYFDPTWFSDGFPTWGLLVIVGVDWGIDLIYTAILFGIIGIRQEVYVRKDHGK